MSLKVQYLRGVKSTASECWSFVALADDVDEAMMEARDVQDSAQHYWGAKSFRVVDHEGRILGKARIDPVQSFAS